MREGLLPEARHGLRVWQRRYACRHAEAIVFLQDTLREVCQKLGLMTDNATVAAHLQDGHVVNG